MKNTTLIYFEKDGKYLLMNRNKKENDENSGKWIGVGGKFIDGESPEDCVIREAFEETGLTPDPEALRYRGIITFVSDRWPCEYMHLFTCDKFTGNLHGCDEGELAWIEKEKLFELPIWEGDKEFLKLIADDSPFFSLKLEYEGENLIKTRCKVYRGQ